MAPDRLSRVLTSALVALTVVSSGYFAVGGLIDPGGLVPGGDAPAVRVFAAYLAARSAVLLGGLILFTALRAWRPLGLLLGLNAAVQLIDAVIGATQGRLPQTIGPACFALLLGAAAWRLGSRKNHHPSAQVTQASKPPQPRSRRANDAQQDE